MKTIFSLLVVLCSATLLYGQQRSSEELKAMHHETMDDPYIPTDVSAMPRQTPYSWYGRSDFFTTQVNIDANGLDIMGDAANEPSLAVDPTNPDRIVVGWRHFETITSNFRQAGFGYSLDGGNSWTFPGVLDPGVFRSDPVLDFDGEGNFYYNSLRSSFECDVYKITDGGVDFGSPFPAKGGDKQWMRVDRTFGVGAKHNYSYWNESFSSCSPGSFTRSTDESETYEDCVVVDGDPFWGTLAVNDQGVLYLVGRSAVGTIVGTSTTARDSSVDVTWDNFSTVDLDGRLNAQVAVNPQGLLGQAWIDVDVSGGANNGNVYVAASVERISVPDSGDVMFSRSTDGGNTFEPPVRINTDISEDNYQWFGTMSVAPNGRIDIVWLDTRDAPVSNPLSSALYYSFSEDGGSTFSPNEKLSINFDPTIGYPQQNKMGDYFDMVSDNENAHLAWTNTINGGQDVYYTRISPEAVVLGLHTIENPFDFTLTPNPIDDTSVFSFTIPFGEEASLVIHDIHGRIVSEVIHEMLVGTQNIPWEARSRMSTGVYFATLTTERRSETLKVVVN